MHETSYPCITMRRNAGRQRTDCRRICVVASAFVLTIVGCGEPAGTVEGMVLFDGKPISQGTIAVIDARGRVRHGAIREGRYAITKVPVGDVQITVHVHPPGPMFHHPKKGSATGAAKKPSAFRSIPARYNDPSVSGLSLKVVAGTQQHDLALTQ